MTITETTDQASPGEPVDVAESLLYMIQSMVDAVAEERLVGEMGSVVLAIRRGSVRVPRCRRRRSTGDGVATLP